MNRDTELLKPPHIAEKILKLILINEEEESLLGDFEEIFKDYAVQKNIFLARLWFWKEVLRYLGLILFKFVLWRLNMLDNYIKTSFRNIKKQKIYSFINLVGLAAGMAGCIMIMQWVSGQTGVNRFHKNLKNIYWIYSYYYQGKVRNQVYGTPSAWGPELKKNYPEIENIARIENGEPELLLEGGGKKFFEKVTFADLSVFKIFTFPLVSGVVTEDKDPCRILIDEGMAEKYFGKKNPLGETLLIDNGVSVRVVGVFRKIPLNSTIRFRILLPLELQNRLKKRDYTENWESYNFNTYVSLKKGVVWENFNHQIKNFTKTLRPDLESAEPSLFPFKDLYLEKYGQAGKVRLFSLIAMIILLIACINFMNLTTARSVNRGLEVGLRKVVGARREQLIKQFFLETLFFTFMASVLAVILVVLLLPFFKTFAGEMVSVKQLLQADMIGGILGIIVFTSLLSGIYPALVLSGFSPAKVLSGFTRGGGKGFLVRKILVIVQFSTAIILMIVTLVAFRQFGFLKAKELGFNREQVISLRVRTGIKNSCQAVKDELLKNQNIKGVTMSSDSMSSINGIWSGWKWEGMDANLDISAGFNWMDEDFIRVFDLKLLKGREYKNQQPGHMVDVIINQTFADIIGKRNPVGMIIRNASEEVFGVKQFRIAGVVRDFHFRPVSGKIQPLIVLSGDKVNDYGYIYCKIAPGKMAEVQRHLHRVWGQFLPGFPVDFHFLDEEFENRFSQLKKEEGMLRFFSLFAILISCLGLFGLAAFMAEQKKREIGIRKVLGASSTSITISLVSSFLKWVGLACLMAFPFAYWFANRLLLDYAYRISISPFFFILPCAITFIVAFFTVIFHSLKASLSNPSKILRAE